MPQVEFVYTGAPQPFVVPEEVKYITLDIRGASGGTPTGPVPGDLAVPGNGGRVQTALEVAAGETLWLYVGGQGITATTTNTPGGYNGGGAGRTRTSYSGGAAAGGTGGGATDVRRGGQALADRIIVAGGGGGAGIGGNGFLAYGGNGGFTATAGGTGARRGRAGTQIAGGIVGNGNTDTNGAGSLGLGGTSIGGGTTHNPSGGGGGGYYGGGGGGYSAGESGGGGGGSSLALVGSDITYTAGYNTGNGVVTINYSIYHSFYSKTNANRALKDIRQPNLTKQRHRYKGVRESQKFNLEMDQLRYDILNTKKQLDKFEVELRSLYEFVMEQDNFDLGSPNITALFAYIDLLDSAFVTEQELEG